MVKLGSRNKFSFSNTVNVLPMYNHNLSGEDTMYRQPDNFKYMENTQTSYVSGEKKTDKRTF
ncbi:MAG: hypothetical protein FDW93_06075 [Bergeyella sp.]|nr:hypothetical protein [Bergeyella sp.]